MRFAILKDDLHLSEAPPWYSASAERLSSTSGSGIEPLVRSCSRQHQPGNISDNRVRAELRT